MLDVAETVVYRVEDCLSVQVKPPDESSPAGGKIPNVFRLNFQNFAAFGNISRALSTDASSSSMYIQPTSGRLTCWTGWVSYLLWTCHIVTCARPTFPAYKYIL